MLKAFFEYVSEFPWETHACTIFGDVPIEKLDNRVISGVRDIAASQRANTTQRDHFCGDEKDRAADLLDEDFIEPMLKRYGPDMRSAGSADQSRK